MKRRVRSQRYEVMYITDWAMDILPADCWERVTIWYENHNLAEKEIQFSYCLN